MWWNCSPNPWTEKIYETDSTQETRTHSHRLLRLPLRQQHRRRWWIARRWPSTSAKLPGVVVSRDYKYMCSDPGQELIQQDIREHKLNRVVVAPARRCCTSTRSATPPRPAGLNPFYFQMVNIREHDSWVHTDRAEATRQGQGPGARGDPAGAAPQGARDAKRVGHQSGRARGGRRHLRAFTPR